MYAEVLSGRAHIKNRCVLERNAAATQTATHTVTHTTTHCSTSEYGMTKLSKQTYCNILPRGGALRIDASLNATRLCITKQKGQRLSRYSFCMVN